MTSISKAPLKPSNYGEWWNHNEHDEAWYQEIFNHRPNAHRFFMEWFGDLVRQQQNIETVLEVGCGRAIPYATFFQVIKYFGTDISTKEINFCKTKYKLPEDRFFVSDAADSLPGKTYDIVFSHAVIDHVYDINKFLVNLARSAKRYIYISAYRSWRPDLSQHAYYWSEPVTCYHNDISPAEARLVLETEGCFEVEIFPVYSGRWDIGYPTETCIVGRKA